MAGYTKLSTSLITSTVWMESLPTKVAWITLLALADADGLVDCTLPGLARLAGISLEEADKAVAIFLAPDKNSRDQEHEGRRLERVGGVFRLLNYAKYRYKYSKEWDRDQAAARQRRHRDSSRDDRDMSRGNRDESQNVTHASRIGHALSRQAEAEAEAEADKVQKKIVTELASEPDGGVGEEKLAQDEKAATEVCSAAPTRIEPVASGVPRDQANAEAGNGREGSPGPGSCDTVAGAVSPGSSCHSAAALQVSPDCVSIQVKKQETTKAKEIGHATSAEKAGALVPNGEEPEREPKESPHGSGSSPEEGHHPPTLIRDLTEIPDEEAALARAELEQRLKSGYGRLYQNGLDVARARNLQRTVSMWITAVQVLGRVSVVEACIDDAANYFRKTSGSEVDGLTFFIPTLERLLKTKQRHDAIGGA